MAANLINIIIMLRRLSNAPLMTDWIPTEANPERCRAPGGLTLLPSSSAPGQGLAHSRKCHQEGFALNESKSCPARGRAGPHSEVSASRHRRRAACRLVDTGVRNARYARNGYRKFDLDTSAAGGGGARHRRSKASCRPAVD